MARVPLLSPGIVPYDAPPYNVNAICAAPGCVDPSGDPHHLWRRSFLAGAYDWVEIPEFRVAVGNVVGLCRTHHDQIESGAAWIDLEDGLFYWTTLLSAPQALMWQPPVQVLGLEDELVSEAAENGGMQVVTPLTPEQEIQAESMGLRLESHDPMVCPSCKRPLPQPKLDRPKEARRERRTWSVTVPKDERENGALILDTLLEASREGMARKGLPYGEGEATKFAVLGSSLALWVQHMDELMGDQ